MKQIPMFFFASSVALFAVACSSEDSTVAAESIVSTQSDSCISSNSESISSNTDSLSPENVEALSSSAVELSSAIVNESSSSELLESSSSEQPFSSSLQQISSSSVDGIIWTERGDTLIVKDFSGDTTEIQRAGRFWILKDSTQTSEEITSLKSIGFQWLESKRYQNLHAILMKTDNDIPKAVIDSLTNGFINCFNANDTTKINYEVTNEYDIERLISECDSSGTCSYEMETTCWEDLTIGECLSIMEQCGATKIYSDIDSTAYGYASYSYNTKEAADCLASHKDVRYIRYTLEAEVCN